VADGRAQLSFRQSALKRPEQIAASRALELALGYASEREQFGVPSSELIWTSWRASWWTGQSPGR
jgi:hypothetical protein